MTAISFDDVNGDGITRDAAMDSGDTFDSRAKNINYGGTGGANVTTVFYQGVGSGARKIGTAGGMGFTVGNFTSRDQTAVTYRHVMSKCWITNISAIGPLGMDFGVGSGTAAGIGNDQHWWTVADDGTIPAPGFALPVVGGFVFKLIDTQLKLFRRGTSGTPDETAMVNFMIWVDLLNTGGTDRNLIIDSPDYVETGFHMVGGDGGDADGTFQLFVDEDQGSGSTNFARAGLWRALDGVIFWNGHNEIGINYAGTPTATEFTDETPGTIICPVSYVREGANELVFDITLSTQVYSIRNKTLDSTGRPKEKLYFDAETDASATTGGDVDVTLDEINYVGHGLETGEAILYDVESGEPYNGSGDVPASGATGGESLLVTGTTGPYYYAINVSADVFAVASSFANALLGTRVALTAQTGTQSFQRSPCTLPDLTVDSDAAPGSWDFAAGNIVNYNVITLGNEAEIADTNVVSSHKMLVNDGKATRLAISATRTWDGEAFMVLDTPNATSSADGALQGSSFGSGSFGGHAVQITVLGTYVWDGNTFAGYGDSIEFDGSDAGIVDTTGEDITSTGHPFTTGEAVEYYDGGGTAIVGLTNGRRYYINSIDVDTISLHVTRVEAENDDSRVNLTGLGVGIEHFLQSMNTSVYNSSGGLVTLQVSNGDTPSVRNSDGSTTVIENSVTVESNGMTEGAAVIVVAREAGGTVSIGDTLGSGLTNSAGVFTFSLDYQAGFGAGLDVIVRAAQNGLPNAAVADDGAVLTDETTAANSTTADDMTLTPDNPQAINDAYYLGHSEQFVNGPNDTIRFKLEVSVAHTAGEPTIVWEFWNGAWVALTFTTADPNPNFGSVGEFIYEFDAEAGWIVTTINGQGPFYYVRARVSVAGTSTLGAAGRFATLDVTKYFRQDLNREITASGLETTVPWNINSLALFDPAND